MKGDLKDTETGSSNKKNRTFQNDERKFYQQVSGECMRTNQKLDAKEAKLFWNIIGEHNEHNRKTN